MARENIIAGLDIGTSKVAAIIADIGSGDLDEIEVIGVGVAPSEGLRRGVVVDIEKTAASIRKAVEDAELMAGVEISSVYAGIAGGHIMGTNVSGVVAVSGPNHEITQADVDRAINAAQALAIPVEREVIHVIPQGFVVDGQDGIKDPVGMHGVRLEAHVHIITGAVTSAQNLVKSVHMAGLSVEDIVLQPLASSKAVMTDQEKDIGTVLVDMGAGTTDIVIFKNGALMHTKVLSLGGWHVTNDIAMGLRITPQEAERIKKQSGCALVDLVDDTETVAVSLPGGRRPRLIMRRVLAEIIQPRMMEILDLVAREIEKSKVVIMGGVILTGGCALMEGLPELAEYMFDMPVRIGYPRQLKGLVDKVNSPIYATGVGLIIFGAEERQKGKRPKARFKSSRQFEEILRRMKEWFADYF
ncbi:cell division protein FtsA [Candidatus Poribacteria bacterium]|nr:MAG: cell division protein FtsA [Candidatus Poribacteria bacterium]